MWEMGLDKVTRSLFKSILLSHDHAASPSSSPEKALILAAVTVEEESPPVGRLLP